jgi:hypothetical protein
MKSPTTLASTTLLSLTALLLASCGAPTEQSAEAAPSTSTERPTLSVPETSPSETVTVKIDSGPLEAGTAVHLSAFGEGFTEEPITCLEEAVGQDYTINEGENTLTLQMPEPGNYQLVLSTDGYVSGCDDPNATTTVKTTPDVFLDHNLEANGETTVNATRSKPFDVSVILSGKLPEERPIPVTMNIYGPFSTEPELRAAGCEPTKLESTRTIQWSGKNETNAGSFYTTVPTTIDNVESLYLITATVDETEQTNKTTTECANYQSVMKVAIKNN